MKEYILHSWKVKKWIGLFGADRILSFTNSDRKGPQMLAKNKKIHSFLKQCFLTLWNQGTSDVSASVSLEGLVKSTLFS